jgi:hypothetical protein
MNIFVLDKSPILAAQYQCDKHVVKMVLETAQILSTVAGGPYKPTHIHHPCVIWIRQGKENYKWLVAHGLALCEEYGYRYSKEHGCLEVIESLAIPPTHVPSGRTHFVKCMPEECKRKSAVASYREYYHQKEFAVWTKREKPYWWKGK